MIAAYKYFNAPVEKLTAENEDSFFAGIRLANNTFKTTAAQRMPDLDAIIVQLARSRGWIAPAVMDVAVSSGTTTVDLLQAMTSGGLTPSITATDLIVNAAIFSIAPGLRVLRDRAGHLLQFGFFGLGVRTWNRRLDYFTGYWLLTRLGQWLARARRRSHMMDVALVSRRRLTAAPIAIVEDDLAVNNAAFDRRFDIVRAANILNHSYFDDATLQRMIENLKDYAREAGSLIAICRTHADGSNHGTVFELQADNTLRTVARVGDGSEIEDVAAAATGR